MKKLKIIFIIPFTQNHAPPLHPLNPPLGKNVPPPLVIMCYPAGGLSALSMTPCGKPWLSMVSSKWCRTYMSVNFMDIISTLFKLIQLSEMCSKGVRPLKMVIWFPQDKLHCNKDVAIKMLYKSIDFFWRVIVYDTQSQSVLPCHLNHVKVLIKPF